jgi:hypothetical protein
MEMFLDSVCVQLQRCRMPIKYAAFDKRRLNRRSFDITFAMANSRRLAARRAARCRQRRRHRRSRSRRRPTPPPLRRRRHRIRRLRRRYNKFRAITKARTNNRVCALLACRS